ncbi:MAG: ABC transporter ATP-binding protein [Bacteroidales bacterium]|nr:ABC transporter ATP-binding protein [Bacteroidales bacterium]MCL2132979.1 ABC transporter ATP-binding protein [Bacteroidales bacterium]
MNTSIEIKQLAIGYGNTAGRAKGAILPPITATVKSGELLALVGRNGIGKSTFLRTLAGQQASIDGMILIQDKPLFAYTRTELSRLVSFVSTDIVRIPHLKVFDLVAMGRFPYTSWIGKLKVNDKMLVYDALEMVGLRQLSWRNIDTLSDGERQRTLIARALVQHTPIMILDEPTAYLDIIHKYEIMNLLRQIAHRENKTVLFSTHDLNIALNVVDKMWIMTDTEILEGGPEDLVVSAAFEKMLGRNNLSFDRLSGEFELNHRLIKDIAVKSRLDIRWLRHALERLNYKIIQNPSSVPKDTPVLSYESNKGVLRFQYTFKKEEQQFSTIYELCNYLRSIPD